MKKKIIGGIIAVILVIAIAAVVIWQRSSTEESAESEIKAGVGETIVYATIEQITGNDIEVSLLEEEAAQQMIELSKAAREASAMAENNSSKRNPGGGMPDMSGGSFQGRDFGGGMPNMSGSGFPDGGSMPDMSDIESSEVIVMEVPESELSGMTERDFSQKDSESKEQEKASYRIPVGTDVITTLGATTTFSHLEEGDTIAILIEKDSEAILKIWMIM